MTWQSNKYQNRWSELEDFYQLRKNNMQKSWYQSRTIWLAVGQAVAGILAAVFASNPALQDVGWVLVVKSLVDGYFRITTKTS